jgi:hypothetical protein
VPSRARRTACWCRLSGRYCAALAAFAAERRGRRADRAAQDADVPSFRALDALTAELDRRRAAAWERVEAALARAGAPAEEGSRP